MLSVIVYCKSHKRKPIRFGSFPLFRDIQGDYPLAWCCACGSEIFDRGQDRCTLCRKAKGETQDE